MTVNLRFSISNKRVNSHILFLESAMTFHYNNDYPNLAFHNTTVTISTDNMAGPLSKQKYTKRNIYIYIYIYTYIALVTKIAVLTTKPLPNCYFKRQRKLHNHYEVLADRYLAYSNTYSGHFACTLHKVLLLKLKVLNYKTKPSNSLKYLNNSRTLTTV